MLIRILYFLRGYVEVIVKSHFIERFINICIRRNIYLWDIRHKNANTANMKMSIKSFRRIRPIAKKTHSRVHIVCKYGMPVLFHKYKRRYFFMGGLTLALCFIIIMSQFIWSIEVVGNESVSDAEILQVLGELGLKRGRPAGGFDARDLKNNALMKLDGLNWLWVDIRGSRAIVSVSEKKKAPEMLDDKTPCDIIASKPGVVKSFITKEGQSNIEVGQTVMEGELLISGVVKSERAAPRYTHAVGEVYARTWYEQSGVYPLSKQIRSPTGNISTKNTLRLFGININFFINSGNPYTSCDIIETNHDLVLFGMYTGISWKTVTYSEIDISYEPLSAEQVMQNARGELEDSIAALISEGAVYASSDINYVSVDENNIKVTLTAEYTEQIGVAKQIETILTPDVPDTDKQ